MATNTFFSFFICSKEINSCFVLKVYHITASRTYKKQKNYKGPPTPCCPQKNLGGGNLLYPTILPYLLGISLVLNKQGEQISMQMVTPGSSPVCLHGQLVLGGDW